MALDNLVSVQTEKVQSAEGNARAEGAVKSAARALQILEFFETVRRGASVTEISRALNYPQSSTSMLLRSLVQLGYLEMDRLKRIYMPTRRISLLGTWVDPRLAARGGWLEAAERVAQTSGLTVRLAIPSGHEAHFIHEVRRVDGRAESTMAPAATRPMPETAAGHAFLSLLSLRERQLLLRRLQAEGITAARPGQTLSAVDQGLRRGWYDGPGYHPQTRAIAIFLDRSEAGHLVLSVEGGDDDLETFLKSRDFRH